DSEQVAEFIVRRQFSNALSEAFAWSRSLHMPIYPILWRAIRGAIFSWDISLNTDFAGVVGEDAAHGDSIARRFRKRVATSTRIASKPAWLRDVSPGRRKRLWALNELLETRALQCP